MDAAFVFQAAVSAGPGNQKADFLTPAKLGLVESDHFGPVAPDGGIHRIHAKKAVRKERGFLSPGARPDFHDHAPFVVRVAGQQQEFQLLGDGFPPVPIFRELQLGELPHFLIQAAFAEQIPGLPDRLLRLFVEAIGLHDRSQAAAFLQKLPVFLGISGYAGFTQAVGEFLEPPFHLFKLFKHGRRPFLQK